MLTDTMRELLAAAAERTATGQLVWRAFDDQAFRAAVGAGHLRVRRVWSREASADPDEPAAVYEIRVSDAEGRVVAEEDVGPSAPGKDYHLGAHLFETARKSALGTNKVLDEMLHALRGG